MRTRFEEADGSKDSTAAVLHKFQNQLQSTFKEKCPMSADAQGRLDKRFGI